MNNKIFLQGLLFIFSFTIIFHLIYSFFGFNPSDDGFVLALSRRLFEGQVPHKDFISIRPVLSPVMHIPEIIIGGNYTFWVSRFVVWFQFALISWLWIRIIEKYLQNNFTSLQRFLFASVCFFLTIHTFPIMAWHTVDALTLYSIGLYFCISPNNIKKYTGYFLIGCTVLCRQNFVLLIPVTLILLSDWKKIINWLFYIAPLIIYLFYLVTTGAFNDALVQFNTQTDFYNFGIKRYYLSLPFAILGFINGIFLLNVNLKKLFNATSGLGLFIITVLLFTTSLLLSLYYYSTFAFFGFATGLFIYLTIKKYVDNLQLKFGLIVFFYSVISSFSVGYNYPAFGIGIIMIFLFLIIYEHSIDNKLFIYFKKNFNTILLSYSIFLLIIFLITRYSNIYREESMSRLDYSISGVINGTDLIKTNSNLYEVTKDLEVAIEKLDGAEFTILPDFAAYWVKSPFLNPLSLDWVQGTELNNPALHRRIIQELDLLRKKGYIIIQKINIEDISKNINKLKIDNYNEVKYVTENFKNIFETKYFIVYK